MENKKENKVYDVITIGAGPAGMTAAIYASRAEMKVLMLEKGAPGGQMVNTYEIENYTGYTKIGGPELSMKMFEHTQALGAEYAYGDVTGIEDQGDIKIVKTATGEFKAHAVIVATGTVNRKLGVKGEEELAGRGISWCAICDGAFYKGKEVAVIGGGNSAVEEALYLAGLASKVTIIHRRDEFRADKVASERAKNNEKIEILWDHVIDSFNQTDGKLSSLTVKNVKTDELSDVECAGTFIYVGQDPVTEMVKDLGITDERGYIEVNHNMETKVKGIYGAGDNTEKELRQVITATNDGAIAAQTAIKYIERLEKQSE
ncbi:thioredoxin-disulfide reductase [Haloplasma contractile]|uniref:Thioredoxin reductase n=1 Tax=Haloplasma contractile SSD-17B TaxID=1033810 RepID=U2DXE8_9MOLU|nr:thioredoxin-disulfide reductase [Haloplasma contractile]ERJ10959.1 Thioredoxin reductase protein [Haloplasma contractile SSD-17B]ERJ12967.1 Thioredoxin reductase protein [Haloplasma contractile SSD-17B]